MQLHSTDRVNTDTKIPNSCQWQVSLCVHYSLTDYRQGHAAHGVSAPLLSTLSPGDTGTNLRATHILPSGTGNYPAANF